MTNVELLSVHTHPVFGGVPLHGSQSLKQAFATLAMVGPINDLAPDQVLQMRALAADYAERLYHEAANYIHEYLTQSWRYDPIRHGDKEAPMPFDKLRLEVRTGKDGILLLFIHSYRKNNFEDWFATTMGVQRALLACVVMLIVKHAHTNAPIAYDLEPVDRAILAVSGSSPGANTLVDRMLLADHGYTHWSPDPSGTGSILEGNITVTYVDPRYKEGTLNWRAEGTKLICPRETVNLVPWPELQITIRPKPRYILWKEQHRADVLDMAVRLTDALRPRITTD